jgi:hypothetical protein
VIPSAVGWAKTGMEVRSVFFETALAVTANPETLQGTEDFNSLYVLIASLVLALIAFVILMRARF